MAEEKVDSEQLPLQTAAGEKRADAPRPLAAAKRSAGRGLGPPDLTEAKDLGARLAHYRDKVLGRTVQEVANRAELAPRIIRNLEHGDGTTKLTTILQALQRGYELKRGLLEALVLPRSLADENPVNQWSGHIESLAGDTDEVEERILDNVRYYILRHRPNDPQMEVAIVKLKANSDTHDPIRNHWHGGDEIMMGLRGTTELIRKHPDTGEESVHLVPEGGLIVHRASYEHWARNPSAEECVYLVIRAPYGLTWPTAR